MDVLLRVLRVSATKEILKGVTLFIVGATPVFAIPMHMMGLISMAISARYIVLPLWLIAISLLLIGRTYTSFWGGRGFIAGLLGVAAYEGMRMPFVMAGIWSDFIPRLGGLIIGDGHPNTLIGYLWRWVGDGGGIGLSFFLACCLLERTRFRSILRYPFMLSLGYGIFIWSGLLCTVCFTSTGARMLFVLTPVNFTLSLSGHLIYGAVLGYFLRRTVGFQFRYPVASHLRHQPTGELLET
ncbi:hypothetical protein [Streptomyces collinus]|uniref:hypothetical protein n=1 Tax=Streptomyces collinus TaxID=42684 RepID=UPI0036818A8B